MVGRFGVERDAAKAAERQPIAHRFLGARVGQAVPLLQKNGDYALDNTNFLD
jgi:hypothetical protein